MIQITLKFTTTELQTLIGLAEGQLFRNEFIDCRLPGFKIPGAELNVGKQLVQRMKLAAGLAPVPREIVPPLNGATGRQNP